MIYGEAIVRFKPKSIGALHLALGGLPDKMRVEADPDIGAPTRWSGGPAASLLGGVKLEADRGALRVARRVGLVAPTQKSQS